MNKKLNILFLSMYTFRTLDDGYICADLIKEFVSRGHNVTTITPADVSLIKDLLEVNEGFRHYKIACGAVAKVGPFRKITGLFKLERRATKWLKKELANEEKFDLIITMISHCAFYRTVKFIKKRDNAKVYNIVKDIFPQNAVDMRMIKKPGLLHWHFRKKEIDYYKLSDHIGALSNAAVQYLRQNNPYINPDIIEVNANSIIPRDVSISSKQKDEIREKCGLPLDKPIFLYGGNLGKPQGVDFIIECLKENEKRGDMFFYIVGSGTEYVRLEEVFVRNNFKHAALSRPFSFIDFQKLCSASDVGLVFLDSKFTIPNYPSRILSYMEAGIPILFAVDKACDAGIDAQHNKYGFNVFSGDLESFFQKAAELSADADLRKLMGANARLYLENNFSVKVACDTVLEHF